MAAETLRQSGGDGESERKFLVCVTLDENGVESYCQLLTAAQYGKSVIHSAAPR